MYRAGDVVSRRKGVFMHRGIVLEDGNVLHNTPFRGPHESSLYEFAKDKSIYPSNHPTEVRERTLENLDADTSRRYNPFTNNCEHLITRATTGRASSPQLKGWLLGAAFATAGFVLTRHPAVAVAGFALGKKLGSGGHLT